MNQTTWNFKLDTLIHEIEMHEHREEIIQLLREQVADDTEWIVRPATTEW